MILVKLDKFRSKGRGVNQDDNMVRAVFDMTIKEFNQINPNPDIIEVKIKGGILELERLAFSIKDISIVGGMIFENYFGDFNKVEDKYYTIEAALYYVKMKNGSEIKILDSLPKDPKWKLNDSVSVFPRSKLIELWKQYGN